MGRDGATAQGAKQGSRRRSGGAIVSPMQGTILEVAVADGDEVEAGGLICVVEAMKMENEIVALGAGVVTDSACDPASRSPRET